MKRSGDVNRVAKNAKKKKSNNKFQIVCKRFM